MNGSIRQASAATLEALETSRRGRAREARRQRALRAIDAAIEAIEEINLSGRGFEPIGGDSLVRLQREVDEDMPAAVLAAPTPVDLHEALLDWQEQLLDSAVPQRQSYRAVDAEIDPPDGRRRRRRRRQPSPSLRSAA